MGKLYSIGKKKNEKNGILDTSKYGTKCRICGKEYKFPDLYLDFNGQLVCTQCVKEKSESEIVVKLEGSEKL